MAIIGTDINESSIWAIEEGSRSQSDALHQTTSVFA